MSGVYPLSVITVVLNARAAFEHTLEGILQQKTADVEYVVIDGGSTDGTLDLAHANANMIDQLISEPDSGIFDAMNKGAGIARGDAIMFLNAGDTLTPGGLTALLTAAKSDVDVSCHAVNVCSHGHVDYVYRPERPGANHDPQHMYWPHPGLVVKRAVFDKAKPFDSSLRYSADLDWINRVIRDPSFKVEYSNIAVVNFECGGASSSQQAHRETRDVAIAHGKSAVMANLRYLKIRIRQSIERITMKFSRMGSGSLRQRSPDR